MGTGWQVPFLSLNTLIIGIEVLGIVQCFTGWRKHESHSFDNLSVFLTFILISWGIFVVFESWLMLLAPQPHEDIQWRSDPVALAAFRAYALKGIIGLASGLTFTVKSLLKQRKIEPQEELPEGP
jgi:hypothetical protein